MREIISARCGKRYRHPFTILLVLVLGACAMPVVQGPYFYPSYDGRNGAEDVSAWLPAAGKNGGPSQRIRIGPDSTHFVELSATADEDNFLLAWRFSCGVRRCDVKMAKDPLLVDDLSSGMRFSVETVRRIFSASKPAIDVSSGLANRISRFAEVPVDQQRYTISIPLRHEFDDPLPERLSIQLPPIRLGQETIPLPLLELQKKETGGKIRGYVPSTHHDLSRTVAFSDFAGAATAISTTGSFATYISASYPWFERDGEVRFAASFFGRDDPSPPFWNKPFVMGEVKVLVLSGKALRLEGGTASWLLPGSTQAVVVPINVGGRNGNLVMYTTGLDDQAEFRLSDGTLVDEQLYLAVVARFQPRKVRITFPEFSLNGKILRPHPIEFEYRQGGLGVAVWP